MADSTYLAPGEPHEPDGVAPETGGAVDSDEPWLGSLLRPLLIVVLVVCINVAIFVFLRQYAPGMPPGLHWTILGLGVLTAILGCTTTTWLAHPNQRLRRTAGYRVAEIVLLLLMARILVWLGQGQAPSLDAFLNHADEVFFDGPYLLTALAIFFTWYAAIDFTDDQLQLALQPDELHLANLPAGLHDTTRPAQTDRGSILRRFVGRWVGWGLLLILIASALRMGVTRDRFWTLMHQDVDPLVIAAVVVYFLVGLLLISQGQLAALRARWTIDRLPMSPGILRNWPWYTAIVVGVFGIAAAMLPLGDTFLISRVIGAILDFIYTIVATIFQLISLLLFLLFSLLPTGQEPIPEAPLPAEAVNPAAAPPPTPEIPPWVGGALFWASMIALLLVAAYFYFDDKETNMRWLRRLQELLRMRWNQFVGGWHAWRRAYVGSAGGGGAGAEEDAGGRRRWWPLRWGNLDPTQQVRYLYFRLLDEAAEHQVARQPGETPRVFAPRLSQALDAGEEQTEAIHALTEAFEEVRYAGQRADQARASWLTRLWEQLRSIFTS